MAKGKIIADTKAGALGSTGGKRVFYGWWIVSACFIQFLYAGGIFFYGFTALFNPIIQEFGWTRAATSLAFSIRSVEEGLLAPIIGFLIDKLGSRRLILFGMSVLGAGFILLSRTDSLVFFYLAFMICTLGADSGLGGAQWAAVANWFRKKRGLAMGLLSAGYGVSGIMAPIMVWMISQYGWRTTIAALGLGVWSICIPLAFMIRQRPEQYGYLPDGDPPQSAATIAPSPASDGPASPVTAIEPAAEDSGLSVRQALKTSTFWLFSIFPMVTGFSQSSIQVHLIPYLTDIGISREIAGFTMAGVTFSSLIGRVGFAWLADRFDKRHLIAVAAALQTIGVLIFASMDNKWLLIPFLFTYGPGYAAPFPLRPALQADYFGLKAFASIRGLQSFGWTIPSLIGPLLAGWVFDIRGSYQLAFLIYGALCAIGVPAALALKPPPAKKS